MISQLGPIGPGTPGIPVLTDPTAARADLRADRNGNSAESAVPGARTSSAATVTKVSPPDDTASASFRTSASRGADMSSLPSQPDRDNAISNLAGSKFFGAGNSSVAAASIIPPDPNAPAGPPPAFEASILDRERERAAAPPALFPDVALDAGRDVDAVLVGNDAKSAEGAQINGEAARGDESQSRTPEGTGKGGDRAEVPADVRAPYSVPPSAEERAAQEVATVRRFETPFDTSTVDVSR